MKVMGLNAGCLLKYFLLYICIKAKKIAKAQRSLKHLICEPCPALDITTINLETSFDVISERVLKANNVDSLNLVLSLASQKLFCGVLSFLSPRFVGFKV